MSSPRRLTRGVYVGDVTALCALPPTGHDADAADTPSDGARPLAHDTLLAGTGASLKWYDPFRAGGDVPLLSATVFPSARVHGILPSPDLDAFVAGASGASGGRAILVWGERRVAVATLRAGAGVAPDARELRVTRALPPLGHWVHDARPIRPDARVAETTVAVGLADNAVELWSLGGADASASASAASSPPALLRRVECSRRSMLYSLALRGSRWEDLRVAGGTIFNEVQLWAPADADAGAAEPNETKSAIHPETSSVEARARPAPFAILRGHEGSIMRVSWSEDGTRVLSTSDDRTARTWRVPDGDGKKKKEEPAESDARAFLVRTLYGHGGRVWDCQPARAGSRRLLVTAGEDCAVRLWEDPPTARDETRETQKGDVSGKEKEDPVATLRGHRGRGVWRCATVRNPRGAETLVTAGADASIKLWDLSEYEHAHDAGSRGGTARGESGVGNACDGRLETFTADATPREKDEDEKKGRDVPRAVCLASPGVVFVGTERGALHEARVPTALRHRSTNEPNEPEPEPRSRGETDSGWVWRANLFVEPSGAAIVSVAEVRGKKEKETPLRGVRRLALGDARGRVAVLSVADGAAAATTLWSAQASPPRRLMDVLVGREGDIFTVVVGGEVALWTEQEDTTGDDKKKVAWRRDGVARSPFRQRALCAARRGDVFALGDQSGNVAAFDASLRDASMQKKRSGDHSEASDRGDRSEDAETMPLLAAERGAHGAHSVSFVEIRDAEIVTGGRDGRLCVFALRESSPATDEETRRSERRVEFELKSVAECEAALAAADDKTRKKATRAVAAARSRVETARAASLALAAPFRLECDAARSVAGVSSIDGARWGDAFSVSGTDDGAHTYSGVSSAPAVVAGFRETDFVIRDLRNQAELLRVACGGWHRPFSLLMRSSRLDGGAPNEPNDATFAFAFVKNGELTACARRENAGEGGNGADAGVAWHARALNVWSHGREVHTVAIVPPADDSPDAPAGVLTGSEDGFVLRAAARGDGVGAFFDPAEVGAHVGGAAVRAIALVPDVPGGGLDVPPASDAGSPSSSDPPPSPPSYILLTAGAKEVLHAWRVSWERASAPAPASGSGSGVAWRLRTSLVATRGSLVKAGHAEWTKGCGFVAASVESDQRYMDVAGFVPVAGGGAVALAATSEGAVSAMALVPRRGTKTPPSGIPGGERTTSKKSGDRRTFSSSHSSVVWRAFADLKFHDRPVLAVDVAGVRVDGGGDKVAVVAATGATDGALAIWEISDALPKTESIESESSSSSVRTVRPCHVTRGAHQSGVNGVAVRAVGGDAVGVFVAASGGDDQVARCEVFVVKPSRKRTEATEETSSFCVVSLARVAVAFAHSSAIKGVWLGPGTLPGTLTLATTSHDQRARVWTASVEAKDDDEKCSATIFLTPVAGAFAECPEPEGLDGFVDARGRTRIAVCGRGVQMFELE